MLELRGASKTYEGGVTALVGADWTLERGEIHTIVGENGAGKSTLVNILGGFIGMTAGCAYLDGKKIQLGTSANAQKHGIGMLRQTPALLEDLTIRENCMLGAGTKPFFLAERKKLLNEASEWESSLKIKDFFDKKARNLNMAEQKKCAVYALLLQNPSYIIFDEPFAHLDGREREECAMLLRRLKEAGKGIALISHDVREVLPLSDRVTVMRDGRIAHTFGKAELDEARILAAMFGEKGVENAAIEKYAGGNLGDVALKMRGLKACADFEVRAGEALGVEGRRGEELEKLFMTLAGFCDAESGAAGGVVETKKRAKVFPRFAGAAASFSTRLSILDNLTLHSHAQFSRHAFLDKKALKNFALTCIERAGCKTGGVHKSAASLSGGTMMRLVIEREFMQNAPVMLFYDADAGLDFYALNLLLQKIKLFLEKGGAAIIFLDAQSIFKNICTRIITGNAD